MKVPLKSSGLYVPTPRPDIDAFREDFEAHCAVLSIRDIALESGVPYNTVYGYIQRSKWARRGQPISGASFKHVEMSDLGTWPSPQYTEGALRIVLQRIDLVDPPHTPEADRELALSIGRPLSMVRAALKLREKEMK